MQKRTIFTTICLLLSLPVFLVFPGTPVPAAQPADDGKSSEDDSVYEAYQEYSARLAAVSQASDIPACGFDIVEDQIFPFSLTVRETRTLQMKRIALTVQAPWMLQMKRIALAVRETRTLQMKRIALAVRETRTLPAQPGRIMRTRQRMTTQIRFTSSLPSTGITIA